MRTSHLLFTAVLLLVPLGAAAADAGPVQTLKQLVQARQFAEAYSLGQAAVEEYEGEADFDFHFGLAALETGHYPEAIFALERVVVRFPKQRRARLELARAYYLSGNLTSARREFQRVLASEPAPPPAVQANITGFLARIDAQLAAQARTVNIWLDAAAGSDSNVNSATADGTIDTPLGTFDLSENGVEQDDSYTTIGAGVYYREPLARGQALDISANVSRKNNFDEDEFDLGIYRLEGGWTIQDGKDRVRVGLRTQVVELDGSRFQHSVGALGSWSRQLGEWVGTATAAVTALRYAEDHRRDTDQYLLAGTAARRFGDVATAFTVYGAMEPARDEDFGEHNGRDFYGITANAQWQLAEGVTGYAGAGLQTTEYDAGHPVFVVTRDDDQVNGRVGVRWVPRRFEKLALRVEARHTDVDSNIVVFDYDRTELEAGLRLQF